VRGEASIYRLIGGLRFLANGYTGRITCPEGRGEAVHENREGSRCRAPSLAHHRASCLDVLIFRKLQSFKESEHYVQIIMRRHAGTLRYSFRLYALRNGKRVIGKGGAQILSEIDRLGSLSATAKELEMSYRFVWRYLHRMEERLGKPVIVTRRGGTLHGKVKGGGGTRLTPAAKTLLEDYKDMEERLRREISKY
jgi:molybdate transport system regulatory protein